MKVMPYKDILEVVVNENAGYFYILMCVCEILILFNRENLCNHFEKPLSELVLKKYIFPKLEKFRGKFHNSPNSINFNTELSPVSYVNSPLQEKGSTIYFVIFYREAPGVIACCNPVPPLVKQNVMDIHRLVINARHFDPGSRVCYLYLEVRLSKAEI